MKDSITILEKRELNLDGELLKTSYIICSEGEYRVVDYEFSTFQQAKEYLKAKFGI